MVFNSEESYDRALALAARLTREGADDADDAEIAIQLTYGRPASAEEVQAALAHWAQMTEIQSQREPKPREWPVEVVRRANDENTGEPFEFTERLFVYEDYVPDLQPHEVDARTRGLAELCLVLLNANEFAYVY